MDEWVQGDPSKDTYRNLFTGDIVSAMSLYQKGGEGMEARSILGSYGYAIKCLAEGLGTAMDRGFVSPDEARLEFRSHVRSVVEATNQQGYIADLEQRNA